MCPNIRCDVFGCKNLHYRKTHKYRVSTSLPSARPRALGKDELCRVPDLGHPTNMWHTACPHFAECWPSAKNGTRHTHTLLSVRRRALGKDRSRAQHACLPCAGRQGAWRPLSFAECWKDGTRQSVNFAECLWPALGKASFAKWHPPGTPQIVSIFIFFVQIFL